MEKDKLNVPIKHLDIKPLSKKEIHDTAIERVHLISKEFTDGFDFLRNYPRSVTFFGGTLIKQDSHYYAEACTLAGRIVHELGYSIITGGGPGIMEAANKGAAEAGGESVGLTIELPHHQIQNPYVNSNLNFCYFFSRKVSLVFSAEAYVVFPGGFGTFDEFFEILTLVQTGKIEKVPIILFGSDFWNPFVELMRKEMLGRGTIEHEDLELFTVTDNMDMAMHMIRAAPVRNGIKFVHHHLEPELN